MKRIILSLLVLFSIKGWSQCTKCTTVAEALISPEKVKSIKMNGWQEGNRMDTLPPSIGNLINIEILYLSDHNIRFVPKEIGNLKKLKELSFAGCQLETLPEEIFTLTNLKELILFDNPFSEEYKKELIAKFKKAMPKTKVLL